MAGSFSMSTTVPTIPRNVFTSHFCYLGHCREGSDGVEVFCDMSTDGGGWTVILARNNQSNPLEDFQQPWQAYVDGFGNAFGEYWLGMSPPFSTTIDLYSIQIRNTLGSAHHGRWNPMIG